MPATKEKAPLILGIISTIFSLLFALVGLITGIIGLILTLKAKKRSQEDYKFELILNCVGIGVSILNMIAAIILFTSGLLPFN